MIDFFQLKQAILWCHYRGDKTPTGKCSFSVFQNFRTQLKTKGFNSTNRSHKSEHGIAKLKFIPTPTSMNKANIEIRHLAIVHKTKKRNTPKNLK